MSVKGTNHVWVEFDDDAFDADQPMSCYRAWTLMQNGQHLVDSSGQYRVNVCARAGSSLKSSGLDGATPRTLAWEFPLTMMYAEHPPNFDVRVAGYITGDASLGSYVATVVAIGDEHDPWGSASPAALYYATATTTSTAATWVIDEQFIWAEPSNEYMRMLRPYTVAENSTTDRVRVVMVRFEVSVASDAPSSGNASIAAVQLREFA